MKAESGGGRPFQERPEKELFDISSSEERSLQNEMRLVIESVYGPPVRHLPRLDVGRAYRGATKGFRYGGDLIDVFQYRNGTTSFAIVDLSGHGITAARYAGLAKYALRTCVSQGFDAMGSVQALNRLYIENGTFEDSYEFFATVFFAIVDASHSTMQYVSAGHDAAYVIAPGGKHRKLSPTGPIVGLMDDDHVFEQETSRIDPGDIFVAVTDGFTEARDESRAFLGANALVDVIEQNSALEAEQQAEALTRYAYEFAGKRLQDDIAALVVKFAT